MVAARPRLLFLGQTLPFPPDGGINIRMYNVLRLLARAFDVTALCFVRRAERATSAAVAASIAGLRGFAAVEAFPIPQEHNRTRYVWDHVRSVARSAIHPRGRIGQQRLILGAFFDVERDEAVERISDSRNF